MNRHYPISAPPLSGKPKTWPRAGFFPEDTHDRQVTHGNQAGRGVLRVLDGVGEVSRVDFDFSTA
jgi:hypothetical protein